MRTRFDSMHNKPAVLVVASKLKVLREYQTIHSIVQPSVT